jgi:hypothetical protein
MFGEEKQHHEWMSQYLGPPLEGYKGKIRPKNTYRTIEEKESKSDIVLK